LWRQQKCSSFSCRFSRSRFTASLLDSSVAAAPRCNTWKKQPVHASDESEEEEETVLLHLSPFPDISSQIVQCKSLQKLLLTRKACFSSQGAFSPGLASSPVPVFIVQHTTRQTTLWSLPLSLLHTHTSSLLLAGGHTCVASSCRRVVCGACLEGNFLPLSAALSSYP
jgi:hypothetical protein